MSLKGKTSAQSLYEKCSQKSVSWEVSKVHKSFTCIIKLILQMVATSAQQLNLRGIHCRREAGT